MEKTKFDLKYALFKYRYALILVVLIGALSIATPAFLSVSNIVNVLWSISSVGIIAVGTTFVILTGKIDLSVGKIAALSGIVSVIMVNANIPLAAAILGGILVACLAGVINGYIVAYLGIAEFIATLATSYIFMGVCRVISKSQTIQIANKTYIFLGSGKVGVIPFPVIAFLIFAVLGYWLLNYTTFGRKCYLSGGNPKAAELSGVSTKRIVLLSYMFTGITCGIAGVILSGLAQHTNYTMTNGYELDVLAAIIVGGASLSGGVGTIQGTLFGVVLIGLINNGLNLLNVPGTVHPIVKGIIIICAVLFNVYALKVEQNRGKK